MKKTKKIAILGLMAALAYISFTFLQIKIMTPGGTTSFHLGNVFCVLASLVLDGMSGGIAGAIGMGIGDLLDPIYITVAPKTIILKLLIGLVTGYVAHQLLHLKEETNQKKICIKTVVSATAGMMINLIGEPIFSYFYTCYILGTPQIAAEKLAAFNAITTSVNAILTIIIASSLYIAIRPHVIKK